MSKLWFAMVFGMVVAIVGSAYAQDAPKRERPSPEQIFKKLDTNADGALILSELEASDRLKDKAKEIFARWDADKDGKVTLKEFTAAFGKHGDGEHKKGEHKDRKKAG
ncbi:MAG TPA: EF-hand domain-containing protein [Thermoguttaceae bacterium]|nr:EF-hand domain-containing protein [Thermoguttaceae bacterium]